MNGHLISKMDGNLFRLLCYWYPGVRIGVEMTPSQLISTVDSCLGLICVVGKFMVCKRRVNKEGGQYFEKPIWKFVW